MLSLPSAHVVSLRVSACFCPSELSALKPINKASLHVRLPHSPCLPTCMRAAEASRSAGGVYWEHIFSISCVHTRTRTAQASVLRALLTPDLIYKWNNGRIMWRGEKQSDSSTLLIRMMVLASCHKHKTTETKKLETTPDSKNSS